MSVEKVLVSGDNIIEKIVDNDVFANHLRTLVQILIFPRNCAKTVIGPIECELSIDLVDQGGC
jgi:hypothetical protein